MTGADGFVEDGLRYRTDCSYLPLSCFVGPGALVTLNRCSIGTAFTAFLQRIIIEIWDILTDPVIKVLNVPHIWTRSLATKYIVHASAEFDLDWFMVKSRIG